MFVLSSDREGSPAELMDKFGRYREYLRAREATFPPSAFQLAMSDWYFSFSDPRAPHDSWLREVRLTEDAHAAATGADADVGIRVRLLNGAHDRQLEFWYPTVFRYTLGYAAGAWGHRDWRFDEFTLDDDGHVVHEIEWYGPSETARWIIVASDVHLRSSPL